MDKNINQIFDDLIILFFRYKLLLKLYHYSTIYGFHHLKVDELLENIENHFDLLIETYQGICNKRINITNSNIELYSPNLQMIISETKQFKKNLNIFKNLCSEVKYSELINIIDNILNLLSKFLYLLSFN